jgi:hypothetical protein
VPTCLAFRRRRNQHPTHAKGRQQSRDGHVVGAAEAFV